MNRELPQFVRDLLSAVPARGTGLNNWLYRTARVLHPYRLPGEIVNLLTAVTAGESLKAGEIERAVARSAASAWQLGARSRRSSATSWPSCNLEQRDAVTASGLGLVDLWETSPVRFTDDAAHTEEIIDALFPGNPLLCVGQTTYRFETHTREEWRGQLSKAQLIVPSPMTARIGRTQEGKQSQHCLANTGSRRFLVIEQDCGDADEQTALLLHLATRAPLVLATHSGGKSIHGWFMAAGQPEERLLAFMRYAVFLGADRATWTRSQFVRMPDGTRANGNRQIVYFFNPAVIR
jgi:hypothetical protein